MHEVLVNRLGGLSLPRKNVVSLTDRPDMTLDVYRGRKTTIQYNNKRVTSFRKEIVPLGANFSLKSGPNAKSCITQRRKHELMLISFVKVRENVEVSKSV